MPQSSGNGYSDGRVATIGQSGSVVAGPVMVGDDDLEPERAGVGDLVDGRDAAVDGEHEPVPFVREALDRLPGQAVALLEAARQVPVDVGAELAQDR